MKILLVLFQITLVVTYTTSSATKRYEPTWDDLDTRPLPQWYDSAKVGILVHWGLYSVPSFGSEWFWYHWDRGSSTYVDFMKANYPPGFAYKDFAPMFTAEFFDPDKWAKLFVKSGAKYIVLTSKYHEGYTLFPSNLSFSWNSVEVGPRRDLVRDLARAVRAAGLKFGVYHSLYEWFNPIYLKDKAFSFTTRKFPETKLWPELKQLVNDYKPSVIWSDGDWDAQYTYWNSTGFLAWLYNDSPVKDEVVANDRWGSDNTICNHGDFYTCTDRYNPGKRMNHKWENAFTIDADSWGYRRNMELDQVLTIKQLIKETISTVSCGGNVLINVGPTKEGTISLIFQERLLSLGKWLSINGEAIYETSPWYHQLDSLNKDVWYTCTRQEYNGQQPTAPPSDDHKVNAIYATILKWPKYNKVVLRDITQYLQMNDSNVSFLGQGDVYLNWEISFGNTFIYLMDKANVTSEHAWSLKFTLITS